MKDLMKNAWAIYRTLEGDHIAKLALALKMAWTEFKAKKATKTVAEKLVEAGYKVWTGGEHKRIYINDAGKYSTIARGEIVYNGKQDIILNGISVWENVEKARTFNVWARNIETESLGLSVYYDVKAKAWYSNAGSSIFMKSVLKAVMNAFA